VRGIGAARRWAEAQLRATGEACGGCLTIDLPETILPVSARVPAPGWWTCWPSKGTERPDEVVIIQGHIDTRASDPLNATADAPGANDDGSGTALVLEAARILSKRKFPATIVYAVLSGEEQGLLGARLLAATAAARGWKVKAVLNNDIVGNTRGSDGLVEAAHVRVLSEGPRGVGDGALALAQRRAGRRERRPQPQPLALYRRAGGGG
jgi:acetylornithine deacetylase/succinyl-diaminopimelate desuccinylase-like protein